MLRVFHFILSGLEILKYFFYGNSKLLICTFCVSYECFKNAIFTEVYVQVDFYVSYIEKFYNYVKL